MLPDIKDLTPDALEEFVINAGEPRYRAEQIFSHLYKQRVEHFSQIKNIPRTLTEKLAGSFQLSNLPVQLCETAPDGVSKFLFRLQDGELIESVAIPSDTRNTICVSTQVGCRYRCKFCASGNNGLKRSLTTGEITGQLLEAERTKRKRISNIVFMGMGEPFDNYHNLCSAIKILNNPSGINLSARKMTVSTAGIIEGIRKFSSFELPVNLAVSLHAAEQKLRSSIMPLAGEHKLPELLKALADFKKCGKKLTLEYALMKDINDSTADAKQLASIAKRLRCSVNIISFNPVPGKHFHPSDQGTVKKFMDEVHSKGVMVSLRRSKGLGISAACGQLAGKKPS